MTRRKPLAARTPSGQISRSRPPPEGPSPAEVARLRDAALSGMRDAVWASSLGRLYLTGNLTSAQFAAGKRWAELVEQYTAACLSPRQPRSARLERGEGTAIDPDSATGTKEARRHVKAVLSYLTARKVLALMGDAPQAAVRDVVERDLYPVGPFQLAALCGALSALAALWGVRK
jgi:hypothetical protein